MGNNAIIIFNNFCEIECDQVRNDRDKDCAPSKIQGVSIKTLQKLG